LNSCSPRLSYRSNRSVSQRSILIKTKAKTDINYHNLNINNEINTHLTASIRDNIDISFNSESDSSRSVLDNQTKKSSSHYRKIHSKKIMIIDDNKFINDSIKNLIDSIIREFHLDFKVIQGWDGVDLLKAVVEDQKHGNLIECVFTDENMEYMNGSNAIKILRDWEKRNKIKNLKLFSITGQEDIQSYKHILSSGADSVLGKPVSKRLLINYFKDMKLIL